jgi:clan AA aspartic protease (TIGR02281 family)
MRWYLDKTTWRTRFWQLYLLGTLLMASCAGPANPQGGIANLQGAIDPKFSQFVITNGMGGIENKNAVICSGGSIESEYADIITISVGCYPIGLASVTFYQTNLAAGSGSINFWDGRVTDFRWTKQSNLPASAIARRDGALVTSNTNGAGSAAAAGSHVVNMKSAGGTYVVPVTINEAITLGFVVDSGASDVSVPADVVLTLIRAGTITNSEFLGNKTYELADGSSLPSPTFLIKSLKLGDAVVPNVTASVAPVRGTLLLGQSFLRRFTSWSINNEKHVLLLQGNPAPR